MEIKEKKVRTSKIQNLARMALCAALMCVFSQIIIPMPSVPFTMQTFGVFFALQFLGGKKGTISVLVFILLGAVGLPVFSGAKGGLSALFGMTGGYIIGFIFQGLVFILFEYLVEKTQEKSEKKLFLLKNWKIFAHILGLFVCYAFGTVWFVNVVTASGKSMGYAAALMACVVPFIIPDLVKLALAMLVVKRVKK